MNVADLSNSATAIRTLGNLVMVTPQIKSLKGYQPKQTIGSNGTTQEPPSPLLFHIEGENTVTLDSDITDHFIEDNTAIQDQIALRPETITVNGFIGELNDLVPDFAPFIKLTAEKLTVISAYTPALSASALLAYNRAKFTYDTIANTGRDLVQSYNSINGLDSLNQVGGVGIVLPDGTKLKQTNQNKQQVMFQQLYGYWRNRYLFDVQTPWAIFQNMAIKTLRAVQDPDTRMITDFSLTFKTMRFATTRTVAAQLGRQDEAFQGRGFDQSVARIDYGSQSPGESATSASSLWNA